jgi:prepilin-type N-terminal cleavage/methylation domain-containing protein
MTLDRLQLRRGRSGASRRGFTLLELVMVMMVLCVVAAMAVPSLRGFGQGRVVGSCSVQLVSLGQYARSQAVTKGVAHRLNIDPVGGSFWLTREHNGVFERLHEEFGRTFNAPDGVTLTWYGPAPLDSVTPYVEFLPTGRSTAAVSVRVADGRGASAEVACRSPGEAFRVLEDWERAATAGGAAR